LPNQVLININRGAISKLITIYCQIQKNMLDPNYSSILFLYTIELNRSVLINKIYHFTKFIDFLGIFLIELCAGGYS